ncbi:hypothetical protein [Bradyrhizobium sp. RT3b]|uniref:hypothetical protein n=1 Tax=Bradyrhizobium sp. RT3b TaxID=3156334 RepID=UPI003394F994
MFKIVVFGLVCIGGIGAIAAATSKAVPVPTPSIVYPTVADSKTDRLSLVSMQNIQPTVVQTALAYTPSSEPPAPAQPKEVVKAKAPEFIPRHWHDPSDARVSAKKPKTEPSRSASKDGSANKLADAQSCRADGVSSMLRKLNLQPACSR